LLSVCLRASAIIALIFFHSPHRGEKAPERPDGLREGLNAIEPGATDPAPLARLWTALPSAAREEVTAGARKAAEAWMAPPEKAAGPEEPPKQAGQAWQSGPVREARRVYP